MFRVKSTAALILFSLLCRAAFARNTNTNATTSPALAWVTVTDPTQLQTAIDSLPPTGGMVLLQNLSGAGLPPVAVTGNNVTIQLQNCQLGYSANGIELAGANDALLGDSSSTLTSGSVAVILNNAANARVEHIHVASSGYSAFMLEGSTVHAQFIDDSATNYNTADQNGHAAFFVYGPVSFVTFRDCSAANGNGNGFRMGSPSALPEHIRILDCDVSNTTGQSAEGITPVGNNIWVEHCRIYKTGTSGILIFNGYSGSTYHNIYLIGNSIGDSSQEIAGNPAMQLNPTSNRIQGVVIANNLAWDDQASPTSNIMLLLTNSNRGGTIDSLAVSGNMGYNQRNNSGIANGLPVANLTNSYLALSTAF